MPSREQIFLALFALSGEVKWLAPDASERIFLERSRRVKLFNEAPVQPACYQAEHDEQSVQRSNLPYKRTWSANWIIYQNTANDPNIDGTVENNQIIDAVEKVMEPKMTDPGFPDHRNTLGGLVWHCFIEGRVFKDPGDIDRQGMLVIPIKLLVP